jgi:CheY-like chemotaxis protein
VGRSRRILLVEDEPAVRDVAFEMLRAHSFAVLVANDGQSA